VGLFTEDCASDAMKMRERVGPAGKGEIFAWCWYDFANSAFVTVVITVVGGVYFTKTICGAASWAEFAWGTTLSVSAGLAMGVGPFLGRWADRRASKKKGAGGGHGVVCGGDGTVWWNKVGSDWGDDGAGNSERGFFIRGESGGVVFA
jgi:hypothetical protein